MVSLVQLLQLIYEELRAIVSSETSVSTPDDHVGVLNRTTDIQYPFFGFEWDRTALSRGMGGNSRVRSTTQSGSTVDVTRVRDYQLFVDIGVIVENDSPRQRDQYVIAVAEHFDQYVRDPCSLHDDISRVREQQAAPYQGGDGGDTGLRTTYLVEYQETSSDTVPAAETVNFDVDVDGINTYPENYN